MSLAAVLPFIGLILCIAGGLLISVTDRPLLKMAALLLLYLGGSIMLLNVCSVQMCSALFVCGIGAAVMFGSALRQKSVSFRLADARPQWTLFRLLLALVLCVLAYTSLEFLRYWIPVRPTILFVSLWIGLLALFSLALDDEVLVRCISLQSLCLAFTILYIYMENSVLVFGFFAVIHLLLAFGGSILSMGGEGESLMEKTK